MKTLRYRIGDQVRPGILDQNEKIRDASSIVPDWDDQNVTVEKLNEVKQIDISSLPIVDNHDGIAPCVCKKSVGKFICIGLNYSDHAEETGMEVPPEPIIFFKATSAIIGPNDDVIIPKNSKKLNRGSKEYEKFIQSEKSKLNIQRFKGLGEMNPDELWNTTLNPETRNLLQVQYSKNLQKDQNLIKTLMGSDVASRKDFIVDNAINVLNLDI